MVAGTEGVFLRGVDVPACEPSGDPDEDWLLLPEELDASFLEVRLDFCWVQCRVVEGDL